MGAENAPMVLAHVGTGPLRLMTSQFQDIVIHKEKQERQGRLQVKLSCLSEHVRR